MNGLLNRREASWFELFRENPIRTLAKSLYQIRQLRISQHNPSRNEITIVCISDTHNNIPTLPNGDILIHAGDLSQSGTSTEIQASLDWLAQQSHPNKVVIAGNHDLVLDPTYGFPNEKATSNERSKLNWHDVHYVEDEELVLRLHCGRRLKIWGSPWTRKHGNWAFQYPLGADNWSDKIPDDTDILITHMPPFAHQDINGYGDEYLLEEVKRIRPSLHVFGHFHQGRGVDKVIFDPFNFAFEEILRRNSPVWNLVRMCWLLVLGCIFQFSDVTTSMVNGAMIGVHRDRFTDDKVLDAQILYVSFPRDGI